LEKGQIVISEITSTFGTYPWSFINMANQMAVTIYDLIKRIMPGRIVIEETVKGRNRWSQKMLEQIHCCLLLRMQKGSLDLGSPSVYYVSPSTWRKHLAIRLDKADQENNKIARKANKLDKTARKKLKMEQGVRGIISKKHLALRWVETHYNLTLKVKEDDIADVVCLGVAFSRGCKTDNGTGY
jgi:hypothetical protein